MTITGFFPVAKAGMATNELIPHVKLKFSEQMHFMEESIYSLNLVWESHIISDLLLGRLSPGGYNVPE